MKALLSIEKGNLLISLSEETDTVVFDVALLQKILSNGDGFLGEIQSTDMAVVIDCGRML